MGQDGLDLKTLEEKLRPLKGQLILSLWASQYIPLHIDATTPKDRIPRSLTFRGRNPFCELIAHTTQYTGISRPDSLIRFGNYMEPIYGTSDNLPRTGDEVYSWSLGYGLHHGPSTHRNSDGYLDAIAFPTSYQQYNATDSSKGILLWDGNLPDDKQVPEIFRHDSVGVVIGNQAVSELFGLDRVVTNTEELYRAVLEKFEEVDSGEVIGKWCPGDDPHELGGKLTDEQVETGMKSPFNIAYREMLRELGQRFFGHEIFDKFAVEKPDDYDLDNAPNEWL